MDVDAFLDALRGEAAYAGQIVHLHVEPARPATFGTPGTPLSPDVAALLRRLGMDQLYSHQAEALDAVRSGRDTVIATGTASGKSLCYVIPALEKLLANRDSRALFLFPTKALCQDQFRKFTTYREGAGLADRLAGVFDGDTPSHLRRRLRDKGAVVFSNPDMLHASIMPQHARWAEFLGDLELLVLDELHTYSGIFGSNMGLLLERFFRVCRHYGSAPLIVASSATIANPKELAETLTGRDFVLVDRDGSPRGRRTYVFWNPPRVRQTTWRSRRSANVEAHELMARLIAQGAPTITFSKAKMTAEMLHRYVCDKLRETAPQYVSKVTPYRGGYRPSERREIEKRLFSGELLGVSATRALELGIDVGCLEACIVVGYPGTLASFFQQSGRAGRRQEDSIVFLIGLDTSVNQYIMSHPEYVFDRCIEQAVIDPHNPFVVTGHLRCATHELPLPDGETNAFGHHADMALHVLEETRKVRRIDGLWYHAAAEVPQHELSLRDRSNANVLIEDVDTGAVLGEVDRYDAPPILHPQAVYMHRGDTFLVQELDLDRNIARVKREEVDYYTQPLGGTDIHHIDEQLREKPFGNGNVYWGEVTAYFNTRAFEKVHFYSLDAISVHGLDLPTMVLETMAFWIVPDEDIMARIRNAGMDVHSGLRGVGYATRMLLPLFMTCDTLDFSHTVGSVNSPWNAVFVYERYPHGLGFTTKAYDLMHRILPSVLDNIERCQCDEGCPCCVGKPLRQYATWNVERGEASIPSKDSALMILKSMLGDRTGLTQPDKAGLTDSEAGRRERLERALRRRLERAREPRVFHPIRPEREVGTEYPVAEREETLNRADVTQRVEKRCSFEKGLRKRIAKKLDTGGLRPLSGKPPVPLGMQTKHGNLRPTDFPGRPIAPAQKKKEERRESLTEGDPRIILGDSIANRARKRRKKRA